MHVIKIRVWKWNKICTKICITAHMIRQKSTVMDMDISDNTKGQTELPVCLGTNKQYITNSQTSIVYMYILYELYTCNIHGHTCTYPHSIFVTYISMWIGSHGPDSAWIHVCIGTNFQVYACIHFLDILRMKIAASYPWMLPVYYCNMYLCIYVFAKLDVAGEELIQKKKWPVAPFTNMV